MKFPPPPLQKSTRLFFFLRTTLFPPFLLLRSLFFFSTRFPAYPILRDTLIVECVPPPVISSFFSSRETRFMFCYFSWTLRRNFSFPYYWYPFFSVSPPPLLNPLHATISVPHRFFAVLQSLLRLDWLPPCSFERPYKTMHPEFLWFPPNCCTVLAIF